MDFNLIPSMSQVWFTGPIAHTTGKIGFEVASVVLCCIFHFVGLRFDGKGFSDRYDLVLITLLSSDC